VRVRKHFRGSQEELYGYIRRIQELNDQVARNFSRTDDGSWIIEFEIVRPQRPISEQFRRVGLKPKREVTLKPDNRGIKKLGF
jgi:hypothetical protein